MSELTYSPELGQAANLLAAVVLALAFGLIWLRDRRPDLALNLAAAGPNGPRMLGTRQVFLAKPFEPDTLVAAVDDLLSAERA